MKADMQSSFTAIVQDAKFYEPSLLIDDNTIDIMQHSDDRDEQLDQVESFSESDYEEISQLNRWIKRMVEERLYDEMDKAWYEFKQVDSQLESLDSTNEVYEAKTKLHSHLKAVFDAKICLVHDLEQILHLPRERRNTLTSITRDRDLYAFTKRLEIEPCRLL